MQIIKIADKASGINPDVIELNGNNLIVYHRTKGSDIAGNICSVGFKAGSGAAYGVGVYTTYTYRSSLTNHNLEGYGAQLLKCELKVDNFLIFDYEMAKRIYGSNYRLVDQIKIIGEDKIFNKSMNYKKQWGIIENASEELEGLKFTSNFASSIAHSFRLDSTGLNGIMYTGHGDGHCALSFKELLVTPLQHAHIDGKTYRNPDWVKCSERTLEELKRLQNNEEAGKRFARSRRDLLDSLAYFAKNENSTINIDQKRFPDIPDGIFDELVLSFLYEDDRRLQLIPPVLRAKYKDVIEMEFPLRALRSSPTSSWKDWLKIDESIRKKVPIKTIIDIWDDYVSKNKGHWSLVPEEIRPLLNRDGEAKYQIRAIKQNPKNWQYVHPDIVAYIYENNLIEVPEDVEAKHWAFQLSKDPLNWQHVPKDAIQYIRTNNIFPVPNKISEYIDNDGTFPIPREITDGVSAVAIDTGKLTSIGGETTEETEEFDVPIDNMTWIRLEVEDLNKKANRLGLPKITLQIISEDKKEKTQRIKIVGAVPILKGWRLIAKIAISYDEVEEEDANGNIIYQTDDQGKFILDEKNQKVPKTKTEQNRIFLPLTDQDIPEEVEEDAMENPKLICHECKSDRKRTDVFIVRNESDLTRSADPVGVYRIIGSSCLELFVGKYGDKNPEDIASYAQVFRKMIVRFKEGSDEKPEKKTRGQYRKDGVPVRFFLTRVLKAEKKAAVSKANYFKNPQYGPHNQYFKTPQYGPHNQFPYYQRDKSIEPLAKRAWEMCLDTGIDIGYLDIPLTAQDAILIEEAIDWAKSLRQPPVGIKRDMLWEIKKCLESETVFKRRKIANCTIYHVAKLPAAYKGFVKEELKYDKLLGELNSSIYFNGIVKNKLPFRKEIIQQLPLDMLIDPVTKKAITLDAQRKINTSANLCVAEDSLGRVVLWLEDKKGTGIEKDKPIIIKGEIESYCNYQSKSATTLKNVIVVEAAEYQGMEQENETKIKEFQEKNKGKDQEREILTKKYYYEGEVVEVEGKLANSPNRSQTGSGLTHEIIDKSNTTLLFDYPDSLGRYGTKIKVRGKVKYVAIQSLSYWNSQRSYTGSDRNNITLIDVEIINKEEEPKKQDSRPITPINYVTQPPIPAPAPVPVPAPIPSPTQTPSTSKIIPYKHGDQIEEDFAIKSINTNNGRYFAGRSALYVLVDGYGRKISSFSKIALGPIGAIVRLKGLIQIKLPWINLVNPQIVPQKAVPAQAPSPIPPSPTPNLPPTTSANWYSVFKTNKG